MGKSDVYSQIQFLLPNCYIRQSRGGAVHLVIYSTDEEEIDLASVMHRGKDKDRRFKLFYPYGVFSDQKKVYFKDENEVSDWVRFNYHRLIQARMEVIK